jgi:hypothetical protein
VAVVAVVVVVALTSVARISVEAMEWRPDRRQSFSGSHFSVSSCGDQFKAVVNSAVPFQRYRFTGAA